MLNRIVRNPFPRQPITKLASLSGRSREISELEYCFQQTASGQSHHCALIGPRGVGKSSLLLSSKELAETYSLLPVLTDLNQEKVRNLQSFWHDLYSSICAMSGQKGCWGGVDGESFGNLVKSLSGQSEKFPLQLPRYFNSNGAFSCPDAVIKQDLSIFREELLRNNFTGALFCIDEADCLTIDVALLQSLRNVFQGVSGLSLILAGTSNLFTQIAEIFSPIPRQFHKIDVEVFPHWSETHSVIRAALQDETKTLEPDFSTIVDVHHITGGDPAEIQLYCHHMYKEAAASESPVRMQLTTNVFKSVLQEFRKFSSDEAKKTIEKLENLCREFIPNCPWLQNGALTVEENSDLWIAKQEFELGRVLEPQICAEIKLKIAQSYQKLYNLGISSEANCLKINDEACLKGLWSSLVKLETGEPWVWQSSPHTRLLLEELHNCLEAKTAAAFSTSKLELIEDTFHKLVSDIDKTDQQLLESISKAASHIVKLPEKPVQTEVQLLNSVIIFQETLEALSILSDGFSEKKKTILRIPVTFEIGKSTACHVLTYFDSSDPNDELGQIHNFISERISLLKKHGIESAIGAASLYRVPTFDQLVALMRRVKLRVPISSKHEHERACDAFAEGLVDSAVAIFRKVLEVERDPGTLNNLAFCLIHQQNFDESLKLLNEAISLYPEPLFLNNQAIVYFLQGNHAKAIEILNKIWVEGEEDQHFWSEPVLFFNGVNDADDGSITVWQDIPVAVGVAHSLSALKRLDHESLASAFRCKLSYQDFDRFIHPKKIAHWTGKT